MGVLTFRVETAEDLDAATTAALREALRMIHEEGLP